MQVNVGSDEQVEAANLLTQAQNLIKQLERQIQLMSNPQEGTCSVFYRDEEFRVALPWASFENYQFRIASSHVVPDPVLLTQLFDLVPSLEGKSLIDVGSYTGLQGLVLRKFLSPASTHMVEPQKTVQNALSRTIEANSDGGPISLIRAVVDDGTSMMVRGDIQPAKLSETAYIRREGGDVEAKAIDDLGIENVGLINLDIPGQKIYALRGAEETMKKDKPVILTNLSGRDAVEIKEFMEARSYEAVRVGRHSLVCLPS
ncbi:FkbM family methyltransferase [Aliiroseovarius sp. PrR006]|uniref:FkbM family methyltransferase n=1 Tax=Aliiroseovarius sp. PrR006 TaxID=2706883 RepID=UPI0013CF76DD|nr:FkbM family methyltransferase [Aliiroseovarius sp. PrR006]NDW53442.1 hypothetical protein [Aliiroseovarius sp. PrR006]